VQVGDDAPLAAQAGGDASQLPAARFVPHHQGPGVPHRPLEPDQRDLLLREVRPPAQQAPQKAHEAGPAHDDLVGAVGRRDAVAAFVGRDPPYAAALMPPVGLQEERSPAGGQGRHRGRMADGARPGQVGPQVGDRPQPPVQFPLVADGAVEGRGARSGKAPEKQPFAVRPPPPRRPVVDHVGEGVRPPLPTSPGEPVAGDGAGRPAHVADAHEKGLHSRQTGAFDVVTDVFQGLPGQDAHQGPHVQERQAVRGPVPPGLHPQGEGQGKGQPQGPGHRGSHQDRGGGAGRGRTAREHRFHPQGSGAAGSAEAYAHLHAVSQAEGFRQVGGDRHFRTGAERMGLQADGHDDGHGRSPRGGSAGATGPGRMGPARSSWQLQATLPRAVG